MTVPRLAAALGAVLCLLAPPALAGSQSSNSSSNCSGGHCSRVESFTWRDDRGPPRGWTRVERWRERNRRDDRPAPPPGWGWYGPIPGRGGWYDAPPRRDGGWHRPGPRWRDRDEDDDD